MHGWKFKPGKTEFGFEEIVAVGAHYNGRTGTISMIDKLIDAVRSLRYPRSVTEVRSLLGLFNQFRDRVPGYALRVQALTQLTRQRSVSPSVSAAAGSPGTSASTEASSGSRPRHRTVIRGPIIMTVEAAEEFKAMQDYLVSPAVLAVFRHGWKTFVYSDASLGTPSTPGGLGGVITQINPGDGKEYVCAFASAGLTPAQRNYPPMRLEALAFVFMLAKFYDWLEMNEFTWRTDAKAHKYITDNKLSPNQALARYFVGLQAFRFDIEWIPGLRMVADPFSRMVVIPSDSEVALTMKSLVFGEDLGLRLVSAPVPPPPLATALFTWSESGFLLDPSSRCLTKVLTVLPPEEVELLVSLNLDLPLSALPALGMSDFSDPASPEPPRPAASVEIGNVHTLLTQGYSTKDQGKLRALLHLREFFVTGQSPDATPVDPLVSQEVDL